jgi:hypothetical protein
MSDPMMPDPMMPDQNEIIRRTIAHPIVSHVENESQATLGAALLEADLRHRFVGKNTRRSSYWDGDGGGEIEVFCEAVHQGVAPVTIFRWPR